ncbi:methyltransferase [Vibrio casei]|uniref:Methyltransferase n=1 Tax=Vibrio casei TaxID=673372 RepID=A0A368LMC0_9VIBR|nr:methyltransferase [Vibrio casei]RCS72988.1 methyltransferase [Vibrio casei]SJN32851.1 SAM-dependent methyltransferases [Vibrio casei]
MLLLNQRFDLLDQLLVDTQLLWRIDPFQLSINPHFPWQENAPELCVFLEQLTDNQVFVFKQDTPRLIAALQSFIPQLDDLWKACELDRLNDSSLNNVEQLNVGIPGRKWQQICAMGAAALEVSEGTQWLEWCSGKGYLGQVLAQQSGYPVTSFEWQQSLCDSGQYLADKHKLAMAFVQGDALSESVQSIFNSQQHAVALHACGDLHAQLIKHTCREFLPALTLSPCCYHLIEGEQYQALSLKGQQSELKLNKRELRIPLQETVTGGRRVRQHRELEMTYRLGLDLLLREKMEHTEYTSLPSIKKSQLGSGFFHFCQWAQQQKELNLPIDEFCDLSIWEEKGHRRFVHMERISLVQQVFRRPLEMWLVCDKALRLQQQGYTVSLKTFCSRHVTPRNLIIQAVSPHQQI